MSTAGKAVRTVVVDASPTFLRTVRSLFEDEPALQVVATAENAQDGLTLVEKLRPDLVLIDLEMPGISGLEAVLLLRNKFPVTRVIMMTAHVITPALRRAVKERGAHGFVSKVELNETLPLLLSKILQAIAV